MAESGENTRLVICSDPFLASLLEPAVSSEKGFTLDSIHYQLEHAIEGLDRSAPAVLILAGPTGGAGDSPLLDQAEAVGKVRQGRPSAQVLLIDLVASSPERAWRLMRHGALGYLSLRDPSDTLAQALREVSQGRPYVNPAFGARIAVMPETDRVSPRESEVLCLVAHGFTNQQIAERLSLSARTVEAHRASLNSKLGFSSRADLVRYALDHGILA